jgi:hypothetical protein
MLSCAHEGRTTTGPVSFLAFRESSRRYVDVDEDVERDS